MLLLRSGFVWCLHAKTWKHKCTEELNYLLITFTACMHRQTESISEVWMLLETFKWKSPLKKLLSFFGKCLKRFGNQDKQLCYWSTISFLRREIKLQKNKAKYKVYHKKIKLKKTLYIYINSRTLWRCLSYLDKGFAFNLCCFLIMPDFSYKPFVLEDACKRFQKHVTARLVFLSVC